MVKLREYSKLVVFHVFVNCCFIIFVTGSSYYHIPLEGFKDKTIYFIHLILLQTTVSGIIYFLSLNKWLFRTIFSLLFLIYGIIGFWVYSLDISITSSLINASLQSKLYIIKDFFTIQFICYVTILFLSLLFIHKYYKKINPFIGIKLFSVISILCFSLFFVVENLRLNTLKSRLPYQLFYGVKDYFEEPKIILKKKLNEEYSSLVSDVNVVMIIGESVRADHLGINGYIRNTTPQLEKEENCISFKNLYTNKTYTAVSLPQMLTDQSIYNTKEDSIQSLYSTLNEAKISTTWIGNQLLERDYKPIVMTNNIVKIIDELKSVTSFHKLKDEALLPFLKQELETNKKKSNMISLHMIGSHWWYENRYEAEFRKYKPVITSKHIPALEKEQIINSYDNTILYLDNFLISIINELKRIDKPTVMIYVSDHGESLGENGNWLHAHKDEVLKKPAFIVWYSNSFEEKYPEKIENMIENRNSSITMDILYFSILDLFKINEVSNENSIFYCEN